MDNFILAGTVNEIEYSHESYGEKFYEATISSERKSGTLDGIYCIIPEFIAKDIESGSKIELMGEIRSRNYDGDDGKRHLCIYMFANQINPYSEDKNSLELDGFICKKPVYRETLSNRKICDLLIAHNRLTEKSDYIPCITWGRDAIKSSLFEIGNKIKLHGRLQSREYTKILENGESEERITHEVSVRNISIVEVEERL